MVDVRLKKQQANDLRKSGRLEEAIILYRELWDESGDKYDGSGYLHCLRKLKIWDEAIKLADILIARYPDFEWSKNEYALTYTENVLFKINEEEFDTILDCAKKIIDHNPSDIPKKMVILYVLKTAISSERWDIVNDWAIKIDPSKLSLAPMVTTSGREGWSDQSLWYYYRLKGLIYSNQESAALDMILKVLDNFPKQRKFFIWLKAIAYQRLKKFSESEQCYKELYNNYKPESWWLYDYSKLKRDNGQNKESLDIMYQAVKCNPKLNMIIPIVYDIGELCKELGMANESRAHLYLCKMIRIKNGWKIPPSLDSTILELDRIIGNNDKPSSLEDALSNCRNYWFKDSPGNKCIGTVSIVKTVRKDILGKLCIGPPSRKFCFINTKDNEGFICSKQNLPPDICNDGMVYFDAIPSYDYKKNRDSWEAINIRIAIMNK
jgi:tetratricopeptide (TPR) repeat protein